MPCPDPSPGVTATAVRPRMHPSIVGPCQRHHPTAKINPTDSQGDFQFSSAVRPIHILLCLPTQVSKTHIEIQKGVLFPGNNFPVSFQPSLPTLKITNITNSGKNSGFAAHRLKRIRPQVTDLHPESGSCCFNLGTHWGCLHPVHRDPLSSASKLHPTVCSLNIKMNKSHKSAEIGFHSFSPCGAK